MNLNYENSFEIQGGSFLKAGEVSVFVKKTLQRMGLPNDILRKVAIATYESEINIISYARCGVIHIDVNATRVLIDVQDEGPGIEDIQLAMRAGYSTASEEIREMGFGAGMGIPNIMSCSDDFQITSEVNKGTHLKVMIRMPANTN